MGESAFGSLDDGEARKLVAVTLGELRQADDILKSGILVAQDLACSAEIKAPIVKDLQQARGWLQKGGKGLRGAETAMAEQRAREAAERGLATAPAAPDELEDAPAVEEGIEEPPDGE